MKSVRSTSALLLGLAPLLLGSYGCKEAAPVAAKTEAVESASPSDPEVHPRVAALDELAALDHRRPVPLQPMMAWHQKQNMMEHLAAIQGITAALAVEDWEAVAKSAALIESSPQMQQMCEHMGAGAEGFTDMALEFHRRADGIAVAATAKDSKGVLTATAHTLETCVGCHAAFRQDVIDGASWQEKTGSPHDPHGGHGAGH